VDSPNRALSPATLPQLRNIFATHEKKEAVALAMVLLSAFYERPLTQETQASYWIALEDLNPSQLALGFSRAIKEAKFWPSGAVLRELSGAETEAQTSERLAGEDLEWLHKFVKKFGVERKRVEKEIEPARRLSYKEWTKPVIEVTEPWHIPETILKTFEAMGLTLDDGLDFIYRSPKKFPKRDQDHDGMGLMLSGIEKFEAYWLRHWRKANQTALVHQPEMDLA